MNINPLDYVTDDFSEKMKKDRQNKRGKALPTVIVEASNANRTEGSEDEHAGDEATPPTNGANVLPPPATGVDNAVESNNSGASEDDVSLSTATHSPANSRILDNNVSGVDITDISQISEILASNNIQLNSSAVLEHNFLPNMSSSSGLEPEAHSTFSREFPLSSPTNVVSSAHLQTSEGNGNQAFQARRKRPSQLNQNPVAAQRPRVAPAPCHIMTRRSSNRQSRN